jgi:quinol monooxygenase YgiN
VSIYRVGEVRAKSELIEELREFLSSILPIIKSSKGCESVQLFQSHDEPSRFLMIEVWDSVESHQASVKNIPTERLSEMRPLLATSPSGSYFSAVDRR